MATPQEHIEDLVARGAEIYEQIKVLQEDLNAIKSTLRKELPTGETKEFEGVKVTVRPSYRFDADKAAEVIPASFLELCQATVIDRKKAQENLPPAFYRLCQVESTPQVFFDREGKHEA